jgi:large subunit ribosomal protein L15
MKLDDVLNAGPKFTKLRRVGRGLGSGMGKTSTRGTKGAGARESTHGKVGFEGGQMPLFRRMPKRGFTNGRFRVEYAVINVGDLSTRFEDGAEVDLAALRAIGLLRSGPGRLKVLGNGALERKLTIKAESFSAAARSKIEAAGGKAELLS